MKECKVTFKGTVNGLSILLREEDDFDAILQEMEKKISAAGRFFKGASLVVRYRGKTLAAQQEKVLMELLKLKSGAEIKSFELEQEESVQRDKQVRAAEAPQKPLVRSKFFKDTDEGMTRFHRGTVRSGQLVSFNGNVVVIGDVNPGGEVAATGNVVVMGSLRGIVRAGTDGNKDAIVVAYNLQPTQLSIADIITRSPDEDVPKNHTIPELAFIKDDMVYIEAYLPQYNKACD